jgi:hypothetical protein
MTRSIVIVLALGMATVALRPLFAQQPSCLHGRDESARNRDRRVHAWTFMREIQAQETYARRTVRTYVSDIRITGDKQFTLPDGFTSQIVASGTAYAASLKDMLDPCGFALFSDQQGTIYAGQPER